MAGLNVSWNICDQGNCLTTLESLDQLPLCFFNPIGALQRSFVEVVCFFSGLMAGPTYHPRVSDHYPGTPLDTGTIGRKAYRGLSNGRRFNIECELVGCQLDCGLVQCLVRLSAGNGGYACQLSGVGDDMH